MLLRGGYLYILVKHVIDLQEEKVGDGGENEPDVEELAVCGVGGGGGEAEQWQQQSQHHHQLPVQQGQHLLPRVPATQ